LHSLLIILALNTGKHTASTRVLYTANNQKFVKTPGKPVQNPWIDKAIHEEVLEKKKVCLFLINSSRECLQDL
jgi:hypothetical protein